MKKTITAILLGLTVLFSCVNQESKDYKKFILTDFSKKRQDTLIPDQNKSYYAYYIKVSGQIDDSIKIQREGHYDIILLGNIDTVLNGDYYGTENIIWIFDPYRAKKGNLEIEYRL